MPDGTAIDFSEKVWLDLIAKAKSYIEERLPQGASWRAESISSKELAASVDHTLLKLDATPEQITTLCEEAKTHKFHTVCVRVDYVEQAAKALRRTKVGVACVIGFHEGNQTTEEKLQESKEAVGTGASELDVVLNRDLLRKSLVETARELVRLREASPPPTLLKIILETAQLTRDEIIAASVIAGYSEFNFIKTSTGFNGRGASLDDVKLMEACCNFCELHGTNESPQDMEVKASGGIRGYTDAVAMMKAGATRLGTSGGIKIMEEAAAAERGETSQQAAQVKGGSGDTY